MKEKRLFIFDLDGTLVDAYAAIRESLLYTMRELGVPPRATLPHGHRINIWPCGNTPRTSKPRKKHICVEFFSLPDVADVVYSKQTMGI